MSEPRNPIEARRVGTVQQRGNSQFIQDESDNKWYSLPFHVDHMIGSRVEIIVRQIPDSPSAAH